MSSSTENPGRIGEFDHFLRSITPKLGDPTYSLLKAHLLFEELLSAYVANLLPHASALSEARLSFAQLLAVARSCSPHLGPEDWRWRAISKLSKMRSMLAHNLEPDRFKQEEQSYIDLIVSSLGTELPDPGHTSVSVVRQGQEQAVYLAVDMATVGLLGSLTGSLGLVPEGEF